MHLSDELLSSYLDGELSPAQAHRASEHLRDCSACAQALGTFAALDQELAAPPQLSCAQAAPFLSAKLDAELGAEEAEIATAHLATCTGCRADVARWTAAEVALKGLAPARPSARVDAFVAALGREAKRRAPVTGFGRAWPVPALAVATAISLVLVLSLPQAGAPVAQPEPPLIAAAQDSVFNPNTNTLYYLKTESGEVIAIDPQTGAQKGVIKVGGKPTALALNFATNTVSVLDASHKTVHEIDGALTTVQSSTSVDVAGTPTTLQVDAKGNVAVGIAGEGAGGPATSAQGVGFIATIDGGTKQVDSVRQVDIAPSVIVIDPNGKRALLLSPKQTILADATTYQPLAPAFAGGIAAAFGIGRDDFAVLSTGTSGALVTFGRGGASVLVGGTPRALTAMPGGFYAVLSDSRGRGVISVLSADGSLYTTLDAPPAGRDLAYDAFTKKFSVVGVAGVVSVQLPNIVTQVPVGANPSPTGTPLPTIPATPAPSVTPTPAVTPTPVPTEAVTVIAPRDNDGLIPAGARPLWPGTYFVGVRTTQRPSNAATDGKLIWYLDDENRVNAFHVVGSGELLQIASLPREARITFTALSRDRVFFVDATNNALYVLTISTEQVTRVPFAYGSSASAVAGSPDGRLWIASRSSGLVGYDARTNRIEVVSVGAELSAIAVDSLGRVWTTARDRQAIDLYDPLAGKLTEFALAHSGAITALLVDKADAVWVGTDSGQTFTVRATGVPAAASLVSTGLVARPITSFVLDYSGSVYYVSRSQSGIAYGLVRAPGAAPLITPMTASEPMFDSDGRAWQADASASGFYVTLPGGRP